VPEGLLFYPQASCRLIDTRLPSSGDALLPGTVRDLPFACAPPQAKAYSANAPVAPSAALGYLTLFPTAVTRPLASTLNAVDGAITSNAAIMPAGLNAGISAFVTERTHLILDINGYFAP